MILLSFWNDLYVTGHDLYIKKSDQFSSVHFDSIKANGITSHFSGQPRTVTQLLHSEWKENLRTKRKQNYAIKNEKRKKTPTIISWATEEWSK